MLPENEVKSKEDREI